MPADVRILTGTTIPIYRQIVEQVRRAVWTGRCAAGDQVPSVRALAEELVINPNTVTRAYAELVRDGVLEARHGKGYFVADKRQVYSEQERQRRLDQALDALVSEALSLDFDPDQVRKALDRKLSSLDRKRNKPGE